MDPDFDQKSALSLAVNVLARYPRERKLLRFLNMGHKGIL